MIIKPADLSRQDLLDLLAFHLESAANQDCSHALSVTRLQSDDVLMFEARDEAGALLGCAALKVLSPGHGEIKSVRTHPDHLRKGVSRALMAHLTDVARARGIARLSLETHPTPAYAAARALYEGLGYTYCPPFGDYTEDGKSVFMTTLVEQV